MASHNDLGKLGEEMAYHWLCENGFQVLHRNWRYSFYEIDIIAKKNNILYFMEVKIRHYSPFGHPEESVTRRKFKRLQRAADQYLFQHPGHKWVQYGIIAITLFKDKEAEYFLLEDVYFK